MDLNSAEITKNHVVQKNWKQFERQSDDDGRGSSSAPSLTAIESEFEYNNDKMTRHDPHVDHPGLARDKISKQVAEESEVMGTRQYHIELYGSQIQGMEETTRIMKTDLKQQDQRQEESNICDTKGIFEEATQEVHDESGSEEKAGTLDPFEEGDDSNDRNMGEENVQHQNEFGHDSVHEVQDQEQKETGGENYNDVDLIADDDDVEEENMDDDDDLYVPENHENSLESSMLDKKGTTEHEIMGNIGQSNLNMVANVDMPEQYSDNLSSNCPSSKDRKSTNTKHTLRLLIHHCENLVITEKASIIENVSRSLHKGSFKANLKARLFDRKNDANDQDSGIVEASALTVVKASRKMKDKLWNRKSKMYPLEDTAHDINSFSERGSQGFVAHEGHEGDEDHEDQENTSESDVKLLISVALHPMNPNRSEDSQQFFTTVKGAELKSCTTTDKENKIYTYSVVFKEGTTFLVDDPAEDTGYHKYLRVCLLRKKFTSKKVMAISEIFLENFLENHKPDTLLNFPMKQMFDEKGNSKTMAELFLRLEIAKHLNFIDLKPIKPSTMYRAVVKEDVELNSADTGNIATFVTDPIKNIEISRYKTAKAIQRWIPSWILKMLNRYIPCTFSGSLGKVSITVVQARDLPKVSILRASSEACDPFVVVQSGRYWFRTPTAPKTTDPLFNNVFELPVESVGLPINFLVFSRDNVMRQNYCIGHASVLISALNPLKHLQNPRGHDVWLPILPLHAFSHAEFYHHVDLQGYIHVRLNWICDDICSILLSHFDPTLKESGLTSYYSGERSKVIKLLDEAHIPIESYDIIYEPPREKLSSEEWKAIYDIAQRDIFVPIMRGNKAIKSLRMWENPTRSGACLFFYMLFCLFPAAGIRFLPLLFILTVVLTREQVIRNDDTEPPPRLPRGLERQFAASGDNSEEFALIMETSVALNQNSRQNSSFKNASKKYKDIKKGSVHLIEEIQKYLKMTSQLGNACEWASAGATRCLVILVTVVLILMWLMPVKLTFIAIGVVFFIPPKPVGKAKKFISRVPIYNQSFLHKDRCLTNDD